MDMSGSTSAPLGASVVRPAGSGGSGVGAGAGAGAGASDGLGDVSMGHARPRLSAEALDRLDMLPTMRLGPDQRGAAVNLDLALGDLQEGAIFAPVQDTPAPTEHDLASLGSPFFQVRDPLEAARVNEFRLKYRSFRQGNAKGSKGEMKVCGACARARACRGWATNVGRGGASWLSWVTLAPHLSPGCAVRVVHQQRRC